MKGDCVSSHNRGKQSREDRSPSFLIIDLLLKCAAVINFRRNDNGRDIDLEIKRGKEEGKVRIIEMKRSRFLIALLENDYGLLNYIRMANLTIYNYEDLY